MFIAIDIGGTKTALASFAKIDPQSQIEVLNYPTPQDYAEALATLTDRINELAPGKNLQHVGLSLASRLDVRGTNLQRSNLPGYSGHNLAKDLELELHLPVSFKNDAVCAARAEMAFGHGRKVNSLLHLIMGTGFGGAYIQKSASIFLDLGLEPEYTLIQPGGLPHTQYQIKGLLGAYLAGHQLEAQIAQPLENIPDNHHIWEQVASYLTMALVNFTLLFQPEIITFSGSLITHRPFLLAKVNQLSELYRELVTLPPLKLTALSVNASLIGALTLCQE